MMKLKMHIKNRISSYYYQYGLFCSAHSLAMLTFTVFSFLVLCYPLTTSSFIANTPAEFHTPRRAYTIPPDTPSSSSPYWYSGPPIGYVQQILIKATIGPWDKHRLRPVDSFRAPVHIAFKLAEIVRSFRYSPVLNSTVSGRGHTRKGEEESPDMVADNPGGTVNGTQHPDNKEVTLEDLCLHVPEPLAGKRESGILPGFACLYISPASLWREDESSFHADADFMHTLLGGAYVPSFEAAPSIHEVTFGVPWLDSGMRRYFMRHRQRVVYYAATVVFRTYNTAFIAALRRRLVKEFPLSSLNKMEGDVGFGPEDGATDGSDQDNAYLSHVSYRQTDTNYFSEYLPLLVAYSVLFFYIYFSVQKIEMVKSKWGLAVSALATVVISLLMSLSICATFGVTPSGNTSDIFPYLVVVIGMENMLVLTRSVVSTPVELDVRIRIAQGLQAEGWNITKHLLTELFILLFGFLTFVTVIQEFCLFAVVGLLVDFFLQMVFFVAILSIDIRRLELSDLSRARQSSAATHHQSACPIIMEMVGYNPLPALPETSETPTIAAATTSFFTTSFFDIPKRVRVMNFFAQFRVLQRVIMACSVVWFFLIFYNYSLFGLVLTAFGANTAGSQSQPEDPGNDALARAASAARQLLLEHPELWPSVRGVLHQEGVVSNWKRLSFMYWPALFSFYDIGIVGKYVSFLPTVKLSVVVTPEKARSLHYGEDDHMNPESHNSYQKDGIYVMEDTSRRDTAERTTSDSTSQALFVTLSQGADKLVRWNEWTTGETAAFVVGVCMGFIALVYVMTLLYACMCGRNYHRWRKRWIRRPHRQARYTRFLKDIQPVFMQGHSQPIECLAADQWYVATSCLGGEIRVWDASTGDCVSTMTWRSRSRRQQKCISCTECGDRLPSTQQYGASQEHLPPVCGCARQNGSCRRSSSSLSLHNVPDDCKLLASTSGRTAIDVDLRPFIDLDFSSQARKNRSSSTTSEGDLGERSFQEHLSAIATEAGLLTSRSIEQSTSFNLSSNRASFTVGSSPSSELNTANNSDCRLSSLTNRSHSQGGYHSSVNRLFVNPPASSATSRINSTGDTSASWFSDDMRDSPFEDSSTLSFLDSTASNSGLKSEVGGCFSGDYVSDGGGSSRSVWCLDIEDGLVAAGCSDGVVEVWDAFSGTLKCDHRDERHAGVTVVKFALSRLLVGRASGIITCLAIVGSSSSVTGSSGGDRCGHLRRPSSSSPLSDSSRRGPFRSYLRRWADEAIACVVVFSVRAHQSAVHIIAQSGETLVVAGQSPSLRILPIDPCPRTAASGPMGYTLSGGHEAPITVVQIVTSNPSCEALSGATDGSVCLWNIAACRLIRRYADPTRDTGGDTETNSEFAVVSLAVTSRLVVAASRNSTLRVWERGGACRLLHRIVGAVSPDNRLFEGEDGFARCVAYLSHNMLVAGGVGQIHLVDLTDGDVALDVPLAGGGTVGDPVKSLAVIQKNTVIVSAGCQLQAITFPRAIDKSD